MSNKQFSERLHKALDNIAVPPRSEERINILAKLVKIPRFKAEALLDGITLPSNDLLQLLAKELDVNSEWLLDKK